MSNLEVSEEQKQYRAKKMMLWFGIISLSMSFAGLTSAYVVSKERADWLDEVVLPQAFYLSLAVIILSSITIHFAKWAIVNNKSKLGMLALVGTLALGIFFVILQFKGFSEIYNQLGYSFTGPTSNVVYSFIFLIAVVHILHIIAALLSLLVVIYNHYKQKYTRGKTLGLELAVTFWHFVDFLWVYLFFFFFFVG